MKPTDIPERFAGFQSIALVHDSRLRVRGYIPADVKEVTQRLSDGRVEILDVAPPELRPDGVLVGIRASLVSSGTERKKIETGRQSLIAKARARPDDVRRVVEKARRDGVRETVAAVRSRLESPNALGYSAAGVVLAVGDRVSDLAAGDRVACGGGGFAVHAEIDYVPGNLAVRVPDSVSFEAAAFTTVGSIALHAVRQADVRLGERVAVIGLGLVGQLVGQILRASGCRVVGVELLADLAVCATTHGAADVAFARDALGHELPPAAQGCDAVIIAAATPSSDPVRLAAELCRDRGRVVVLGDVGLEVPRAAYYEKELDLRTSCAPMDPVATTPNTRNAASTTRSDTCDGRSGATWRLSSSFSHPDKIDVAPLIGERLPLGVILEYSGTSEPTAHHRAPVRGAQPAANVAGFVGAGSYATRVLIPACKAAGFRLEAIASAKRSRRQSRSGAVRFRPRHFGRRCADRPRHRNGYRRHPPRLACNARRARFRPAGRCSSRSLRR